MLKKMDSRAVSFSEARMILEDRKVSEFSEEQKRALDYLRAMPKISSKDLESARQELGAIEGLKDHQIATLLSLFPKDEEEVGIIFSKERMNLSKDQAKKILEALDKIRPSKK